MSPSYIMNSGYVSALSAAYSMTVLCLQYLTFECFDQHCSETSRVASAMQGDMAFQDYAVAHWCDHIIQLADISLKQDVCRITSNNELSDAVEDFSNQFEHDLATSQTTTHNTVPDSIANIPYSTLLGALWTHSTTVQAQKDDSADVVSLSSLSFSLSHNRKAIEEAAMSGDSDQYKLQQLDTFYGKNLFKCPRRTCYFFHQGFDSARRREDHNDRHERPFRCPEDDCPAQIFGMASQKELDKHQKKVHPGASSGPPKFARLKRAKVAGDGSVSLKCEWCHQHFSRRYELRRHVRFHASLLRGRASVIIEVPERSS